MIVAADPGLKCGIFWTDGSKHGYIERDPYHAVLDIETRFLNDTWRSEDTVLVLERYDITAGAGKMTRQYEALEIIGALRYLARKAGVECVMQARADRLRVTNEMLDVIGWNVVSAEHAREAARHALVQYVVRYSQQPIVRRLVAMMNAATEEANRKNEDIRGPR